ncbi:DNA polymerase delta small subunit Cdc1 [Savitreella phatthalungensis]
MAANQKVRRTHLQPGALDDHFVIDTKSRNYRTQYANIYYLRLALLKPLVQQHAAQRWGSVRSDHQTATHTDRILDTVQGELTWLIGTVYMDMRLKPNILEDIKMDVAKAVPGSWRDPRDQISLEDESGRIRLVGERLTREILCTGIVIGVLGSETSSGDFEVVDIVTAGSPPLRTLSAEPAGRIAMIAGIESGSLGILTEALTGDLPGMEDISTLVLLGSSILPVHHEGKYGATTLSHPTEAMKRLLSDLGNIDVVVLPGKSDPSNVTLPQQAMHRIIFGCGSPDLRTNPCWLDLAGRSFLCCSGQTLDDLEHYVDHEDRIDLMQATLDWRHIAPTAPDTLWTYPFSDDDPFILKQCPEVYAIASETFASRVNADGTLLLAVPRFRSCKQLVVLDALNLNLEVIQL